MYGSQVGKRNGVAPLEDSLQWDLWPSNPTPRPLPKIKGNKFTQKPVPKHLTWFFVRNFSKSEMTGMSFNWRMKKQAEIHAENELRICMMPRSVEHSVWGYILRETTQPGQQMSKHQQLPEGLGSQCAVSAVRVLKHCGWIKGLNVTSETESVNEENTGTEAGTSWIELQ
jgi:hypothetical protein